MGRTFIAASVIASMLASSAACAAHGAGRGAPITNPTTTEVGITPDADVYGASLGLGKRLGTVRVSASIPYYVLDAGGPDTESGMGDVRVVMDWDVVPETPRRFSLTASFLWKLPTADENKGLGTGETDYGAFVDLAHRLDGMRPFATLGYVWTGDAPGLAYRDTWLYSLGVSAPAGANEIYASFDTRAKTLPGFDDTRLLSAGWVRRLNTDLILQLDVSAGLNDSSPDVLVNVELRTWF